MRLARLAVSAVVLGSSMGVLVVGQATTPATASKQVDAASKLPAPILAAFKTSYPNATIKSAAQEREEGKVVWEVESIDHGLSRDLVYNPDGTVVEIEEEVPLVELPAPVTSAVHAQFPKATIVKGERLTRGKTLQYELQLKGADRKSIELTPEGKPVIRK